MNVRIRCHMTHDFFLSIVVSNSMHHSSSAIIFIFIFTFYVQALFEISFQNFNQGFPSLLINIIVKIGFVILILTSFYYKGPN